MTDKQKAWEIEVTETIAAMRDIVPEGSNFEERLGRHRLEVKVSTLLCAAAIVQRAGDVEEMAEQLSDLDVSVGWHHVDHHDKERYRYRARALCAFLKGEG